MKIGINRVSYKLSLGWLLYALAFMMLFFCTFYESTTFVQFAKLGVVRNLCRVAAACMIAIKCVYVDRFNLKNLFAIACLMMLDVIVYYFSRRGSILDLAVLMIGAAKIQPRKIVKLYAQCASVFLAVAFLCSTTGIILDYTTVRVMNGVQVSDSLRHSFGINYPTDFAAHVFFIYICYYYLKADRRKINVLDFLVTFLIVAFLDHFCEARLSEGCILIALVLFTIADHWKKLFDVKLIKKLICWIFPLCAVLTIGATYLYDSSSPMWVMLDEKLFSKRLSVSHRVMQNYGFSLLGQEIKMQGLGYKVDGYDPTVGTTYIDSSYVQVLMLYGIITTVFLLAILVLFTRKAVQEKNLHLQCVIIVLAVSCIMNQYLLIISYNPFIIVASTYVLTDTQRASPKWNLYAKK